MLIYIYKIKIIRIYYDIKGFTDAKISLTNSCVNSRGKMMQILLCCAAGMSTSILVSKMQDVARSRGLKVNIYAIAVAEFERSFQEADVILLGPQVQYEAARLSAIAAPLGKPVAVIDMVDYGMMRGEQVLDTALALHTA